MTYTLQYKVISTPRPEMPDGVGLKALFTLTTLEKLSGLVQGKSRR
jgi:hypothetical protein